MRIILEDGANGNGMYLLAKAFTAARQAAGWELIIP